MAAYAAYFVVYLGGSTADLLAPEVVSFVAQTITDADLTWVAFCEESENSMSTGHSRDNEEEIDYNAGMP